MKPEPGPFHRPSRSRQRLPRSFKELTPTKAFNPRTFFYEMVWKALLTRRKVLDVRRLSAEGTGVPGVGRDYGAIWLAIFNADPMRQTSFELGLTLRKDTRGMKK